MADFSKLLRSSLDGANEAYHGARDDFLAVVTELNTAVVELTQGKASIAVTTVKKAIAGTLFSVVVQRSDTSTTIGSFEVGRDGYPIEFGTIWGSNLKAEGTLESKQGIESFFADMLTNRKSTLIEQISFALRK